MPMKIASVKNENPSIANPSPNTEPNVAMKPGHRSPISKLKIVPLTTPRRTARPGSCSSAWPGSGTARRPCADTATPRTAPSPGRRSRSTPAGCAPRRTAPASGAPPAGSAGAAAQGRARPVSGSEPPPPPPTVEQSIRLRRPLRPRGGLRGRRGHVLIPRREDRVDDPPLCLDFVVAGEQRRVAAHRVEDQALVGLRGLRRERGAVVELHVDRVDPHQRPGDLRPDP